MILHFGTVEECRAVCLQEKVEAMKIGRFSSGKEEHVLVSCGWKRGDS
jgi:hypothetical protein